MISAHYFMANRRRERWKQVLEFPLLELQFSWMMMSPWKSEDVMLLAGSDEKPGSENKRHCTRGSIWSKLWFPSGHLVVRAGPLEERMLKSWCLLSEYWRSSWGLMDSKEINDRYKEISQNCWEDWWNFRSSSIWSSVTHWESPDAGEKTEGRKERRCQDEQLDGINQWGV